MDGAGAKNWGWDPDAKQWREIKVSPTGALYMIETVDKLDDIGDVNAPAPADNEALTWDAATEKWIPEAITPGAHAASHQDGGADEISVEGLSGLLADEQDAGKIKGKAVDDAAIADDRILVYKSATTTLVYEDKGAPSAHAATHQDGGADEINVAGLSGLLADDQHVLDSEVLAIAAPLVHAGRHEDTGADEINVTGLSGLLADDQHVIDAEVLAVAAPLVHATRHQNGGADEISLAGLSGDPADTINKSLLTTRGDTIRRGAAAPERYAIGAAGTVLTSDGVDPIWATSKGARVYHDAVQEIPDATVTTLAFNSERFDTDTIHDPVTNNERLTCHTAGKYLIWANVGFAPNVTGIREAHIRHYRTAVAIIAFGRLNATTAFATAFDLATVYDLAVDDYVYITVYQNSGGALNVLSNPQYTPEFGMQRIG